jgi:hypothetical protein
VSANDKPSVVSKPSSGDAAEARLKTEVMQLPPRDRRRIKAIPEVCRQEVLWIMTVSDFVVITSVTLMRLCPMRWKNIISRNRSSSLAKSQLVLVV